MDNDLFEVFNNGYLKLPTAEVEFSAIPWSKHPTFVITSHLQQKHRLFKQ